MKKLKNGMKVKIRKSDIKYNWSNIVHKMYVEQQTCIVINAHIEPDYRYSRIKNVLHWVCDLQTQNDGILSGFGIEELKRTFTLLMIIEKLTENTLMEDIGKEISEKARAVFDYYADKD